MPAHKRTCLTVFAWIFATLALLLAIAGAAAAQSPPADVPPSAEVLERQAWIHANGRDCCPHDNCHPAPGAELTPEGWRAPGLAGRVPSEKAKPWPFKETYACHYKGTRALSCIFRKVPDGS